MSIYLIRKAEIILLLNKNGKFLIKYLNSINIFTKKLAIILLEQ